MSFWIFKVSEQRLYADLEGVRYEYDNRHSVRVRPSDRFVYLDKRGGGYRFTGAGSVSRVDERPPTESERRRGKTVRMVYAALLADMTWFEPPLDISSNSNAGQRNRELLGIPEDINAKGWGWSISMPSISAEQFRRILDSGLINAGTRIETPPPKVLPSWAPAEGLLLVRSRSDGPGDSLSLPRRAGDPTSVGRRAEQIVRDFLAEGELKKFGGTRLRWTSRDREQPGWDIEYEDAEGFLNAVEVKGTTALRFTSIDITENEWRAAAEMRHCYWLYLVADCLGRRPQVQRVQDPFGLAEQGEFRVVPVVWRLHPSNPQTRSSST